LIEIIRYPYSAILGWSVSRYDTFTYCKRQYFYQYYGKFDLEYPRAKIDALKSLTSLPLEIGNLAHDTIAVILRRLLKSEDDIDSRRFQEFVRKNVTEASREKTFFEVYYTQVEAVQPEDMLPEVMNCLQTFLSSSRFAWIKEHALAHKHQWLIEPPGYGEARVDGMKVYCKVDFLFVIDGQAVILDWKTGKPNVDKHHKQMIGYISWASHHLAKPPGAITAVIAYLKPSYQETSIQATPDILNDFTARIQSETREMQSYCVDINENLPKNKTAFPMTDQLALCKYCNFKELCKRQ
jgi:hypothetical protein